MSKKTESLDSLGIIYRKLGDANKSLDCLIKSSDMHSRLHNGDNLEKAITLNNLGITYSHLGKDKKA